MHTQGRKRVIIEKVTPVVNNGEYPIKRIVGEKIKIKATVFSDGHDEVSAAIAYRNSKKKIFTQIPMEYKGNDQWEGLFSIDEIGLYYYTVRGWVDHFHTWQNDCKKKSMGGHDIKLELLMGIHYLDDLAKRAETGDKERLADFLRYVKNEKNQQKVVTFLLNNDIQQIAQKYPEEDLISSYKELELIVERKKALFSSWYELFPRSTSKEPNRPGTFKDCKKLLAEISHMGFDVLYFPPIHPIGTTNRKGKNNEPSAMPNDVGSPWAIGSEDGGHKAVYPLLGTLDDFKELVSEAKKYGIEIALDLAFQCSPDHPYVKEHPEWFKKRADGTIQYAENPPKKYEDIVPLDFETENWQELWEELRSIVVYWIDTGVTLFRVDNPHTKALPFWAWLIREIKKEYPEVIFCKYSANYFLKKYGTRSN